MKIAKRFSQPGISKSLLTILLAAFVACASDFAAVTLAQQADPPAADSANEEDSIAGAESMPGVETKQVGDGNAVDRRTSLPTGKRRD